jgi:hypothetical protein
VSSLPPSNPIPSPTNEWGFKCLLLGDTGTGKTYSIRTLAEAGLEVFVLFTENGMLTLRDTDPNKVHWHYIRPAPFDINAMKTVASNISKAQFQQITAMVDANKSKYGQLVDVLSAMAAPKCDRTGKTFPPVDQWGTDKVLVIDSLSGLSLMALTLVIGGKPAIHEGEWGIAMMQIEKLLNALCLGIPTNFVLMSHIEREPNAMDGSLRLMASTLGKKLAPKLPRFFDEVLVSFREIDKFQWSTAYPNAETKSRVLGMGKASLPPSFVPLVKAIQSAKA